MKYIIVGLGNFGSSLGMALTRQGHEVIAIDIIPEKIEQLNQGLSPIEDKEIQEHLSAHTEVDRILRAIFAACPRRRAVGRTRCAGAR